MLRKADTAPCLEHGKDHREPRIVPSDDGPPRRAERRLSHECLDLDQERTGALQSCKNGCTGGGGGPVAKEKGRWIGNLHEALSRHFENADFIGRPEPVLDRAQDSVLVRPVALEIEHGVDHVFDNTRTGDLAVLCDVAHEHKCRSVLLGIAHHGLR